jgi:hypothetical protein
VSFHLSKLEIGGAKRIFPAPIRMAKSLCPYDPTSGVLRGSLATTLFADVVFLRVVTRRRATLSSAELTVHDPQGTHPQT